jgi:MFS family permease
MAAAATAIPVKRMSRLEQFNLSFYWFSANVLWGAVLSVLVQSQVLHMVPDEIKGRAVGVAVGLGSLTGLILPPFMGAWSDRVRFKMGRRRPFMLIGTAVNLLGLVGLAYFPFLSTNPLLGFTVAFWLFVLAYLVTNAASNFATAPFSALMPDVVPQDQRGAASGWLGVMTILGQGVGIVAAGKIISNSVPLAQYQSQIFTVYALIGIVLVIGVLITVFGTKERPLVGEPKPFRWGEFWASLVTPFQSPDFAWVVFTRLLVMMGILTINNNLEFYMKDVVKDYSVFGVTVATTETDAVSNVLLLLLVFAVIGSIAGGQLSDKHGRKRLVYLSGGVMSIVALGLIVTHQYLASLFIGALFGIGYGAYTSVDWALATDVLPNMDDAAKDMGIWHVALTLPQLLAVPVAGVLLDFGQQAGKARGLPNLGYSFIFTTAIVYFVLGTVFVSRVKKAR